MASQNSYLSALVPLEGGLDFVTPKTNTAPGTLSDCLNYEVADRLGYRRINGYVPFDGVTDKSLTDTNLAQILLPSSTTLPVRGYLLYSRNPGKYKIAKPFGIKVGYTTTGTSFPFVVIDYSEFANLADSIFVGDGLLPSGVPVTEYPITGAFSFESANGLASIKESLQIRYDVDVCSSPPVAELWGRTDLSDNTKKCPIIGLHTFKDESYAIQDLSPVFFKESNRDIKPGDVLEVGPLSQYITVRKVVSGSGSPALGTGTGIIYTDYPRVLTGSVNSGINFIEPDGTSVLDIAKVAASYTQVSPVAAMYKSVGRSDEEIWQAVDAGYYAPFKNGKLVDGKPPQAVGRTLSPTATQATAESTPSTFTTSTDVGGTWAHTGALEDVLLAKDANLLTDTVGVSINPNPLLSVTLSDLVDTSQIPADAVVLGVKVDMSAGPFGTAGFGYSMNMRVGLNSATKTGSIKSSPNMVPSGISNVVDFSLGGNADLWDSDMERGDLDSLSLDIYTYYNDTGSGTSLTSWNIDKVLVTIYYQVTSQYYYFSSSTNDSVRAVLVNYQVTEGSWEDGDASGTMLFAQVQPSEYPGDAPTRRGIRAGDEMHLIPQQFGVATDHFADIDSDMIWNYLDPTQSLLDNDSRYQFITANFYGNEDWESMYAVSGAGRAFAYDGYYLRRIYTGLPDTVDKPRHIAVFNGALALGYPSGNVTLSVIGDPENFDGILGATSLDVGDKVTGLLDMNGAMLAVGGERSISGLTGKDNNTYALQKLSPYEGMIEYTLVNVGKPVYCSPLGISTLTQSDAYGDFLGTRLSSKVYPWLLPRLQSTLSPVGYTPTIAKNSERKLDTLRPVALANKVVVATPVRSKNQYKLWFADGYQLTMTMQGEQQVPSFTIQKYNSPEDLADDSLGFIPRAESAVGLSNGQERIIMSHCNQWKGDFSVTDASVFEMGKGYSFRTNDAYRRIQSYIGTNHAFLSEMQADRNIQKIRVHGNTYGYAPMNLYLSKNYQLAIPDLDTDVKPLELIDFVLPEELPRGPYIDLYPATKLSSVATEGLSFTVGFIYRDVPVMGDNKVSPPYTLQSLVIQYKHGKGDI